MMTASHVDSHTSAPFVCRRCLVPKEASDFYNWSNDHMCKSCCSEDGKRRAAERTEEERERIRERRAEWRKRNIDHVRAKNREWQARQKKSDPATAMLRSARYRCRRDGIPFDLTLDDVIVPERCPVLGIPLEPNWGGPTFHDASPSLDRIDPERGYVRGNVAVISLKANRLKSNATTAEIEALAAWMRKVNAP